MTTIYKYTEIIRELISNKRLSMKNNQIIFDGRTRKIATSNHVITLPIDKTTRILPNCFLIAYLIQTGLDIPEKHKVIPIEGLSLTLANLKIVPIDSYRGPPANKDKTKFTVAMMAAVRKEYRERFIAPCSFSMLRKKYNMCNTQIVNILYNTSQEAFWLEVAAIEPPLKKEDSKRRIKRYRHPGMVCKPKIKSVIVKEQDILTPTTAETKLPEIVNQIELIGELVIIKPIPIVKPPPVKKTNYEIFRELLRQELTLG